MTAARADRARGSKQGLAELGEPFGATFFARPAEEVARDLLGRILASTVDGRLTAGRIVETEAYLGSDDPASHAAARIGRTARNEAMFGPGGHAYVYFIYGVHWCLNVVTGAVGSPSAVLIRAVEPVTGVDLMRQRRAGARRSRPRKPLAGRQLTGGPARAASALGVTGELNGHALDTPPLLLLGPGSPPHADEVAVGPRIGITRAQDWPLRYYVRGSRWISR